MPQCGLCGKKCRVDRYDRNLLEGDIFYDYYCPDCSNTKEGTFERHQLSWQTVIHLVLYHLQKTSSNPDSQTGTFFRWKEDICGFIERSWNALIPHKNHGVSWQNSVSSVLSAHHEVFQNGLEAKGETGWWSLRVVEAPKPKNFTMSTSQKQLPLPSKRKVDNEDEGDEIKSEAGSIDLGLEEETLEMEVNTSEMIKKRLLSRLLSEDSNILQAALSKVKTHQGLTEKQSLPPVDASAASTKLKASITRVPPVENELLRILQRIKNPDAKMKRLRRKLIARRERRKGGMELFDIDLYIYNYLKDPRPFLSNGERSTTTSPIMKSVSSNPQSLETPYQKNPYLSMRVKTLGITDVAELPTEFTSPYSGRPLPACICRSEEDFMRTNKGMLLHSIKRLSGEAHPPATIDYVHLRKEYIAPVNRLLSAYFWPAIDISDHADYPDLSILAVYNRLLVVGVALLTPDDAYLSHLFVHPEWSDAGIGTRLMYLLLQNAPPRDITLHVSATSPAMLLYNKFGFKPEQFIRNHYDRYYSIAEADEVCRFTSTVTPFSRHAFLLRLRR